MKDFDELLDEVLREEGEAMPRPGLETRVMARLHSDERSARSWLKSRWLAAGAMAAAACVVAAVVWVAPQDVSTTKVKHPVVTESGESSRASRDAHLTLPPSNGQGSHLSDDKAVARMGHLVVAEPKATRSLVVAQQKRQPKLETFPAVTQKGEAAGWLEEGGDSKLVAAAKEMSPQALKALQELQESQSRPLTIAAIEIKPLQ